LAPNSGCSPTSLLLTKQHFTSSNAPCVIVLASNMFVSRSSFVGFIVSLLACASLATAEDSAIHLTLHRRGDRFATHEEANLTRLAEVLAEVETRYAKAERIIEGNRLGQQWKSRDVGTTIDEGLINGVGQDGRW
jgi:hypothetical protein